MEPVTFIIGNDFAMIPVVQAGATAYLRTAGAAEDVARQTELVIEEIVTNILQYEYLEGQHETLHLTLSLQDETLRWKIRFRGIPFDVEHLKQWEEKTGTDQIMASGGRGLGLRLLRQYSDDVIYRNLGWQGQEILIRRKVSSATPTLPTSKTNEKTPKGHEISIRRMRPEDAPAVSKLAYFAYRYTYIREYAYDPAQVRLANEDGRMKSYVISDNKTGEILGHMAQFRDDLFNAVPEFAAGFVHPRFRGGGSFNELTALMVKDAKAEGWTGVCGMTVTSHFYSQKAAVRAGIMEAACLFPTSALWRCRTSRKSRRPASPFSTCSG
jgi:anti-sigma regulatory factor (Ser/Thr protein kinase)